MKKRLGATCMSAILLVGCKAAPPKAAAPASSPPPAPTTTLPKAWTQEPAAYRSVKWGASPEEAAEPMKSARNHCWCTTAGKGRLCGPKTVTPPPDTRMCYGPLTLGSMKMEEYWSFEREGFVGASLKFDSDDYAQLRDIFVEKYGPPGTSKSEELTTGMGVKATNEHLEWKGPNVGISLIRFSGNIREGYATVATTAWIAAVNQRAENAKAEAAKAF